MRAGLAIIALACAFSSACLPPEWGANALLHPTRRVLLGAAVGLQAAAQDSRIPGVIAQSAFSDLEVVARERAPWIATRAEVDEALTIAERSAGFQIADVSPRKAAARIRVPVLFIHGAKDRETPASHAQAELS